METPVDKADSIYAGGLATHFFPFSFLFFLHLLPFFLSEQVVVVYLAMNLRRYYDYNFLQLVSSFRLLRLPQAFTTARLPRLPTRQRRLPASALQLGLVLSFVISSSSPKKRRERERNELDFPNG